MAKKVNIQKLPLEERKKSFKEETLGIRPQMAVAEAMRCLLCNDPPCEAGCGAGVSIKQFIRYIRSQNFRSAIDLIKEKNIFAGTCARVCPQEACCEVKCTSCGLAEPIAISALQRFVADVEMQRDMKAPEIAPSRGIKVAVVGAGPAGLSCAAKLAILGYSVDVFEKMPLPGGILTYGIPPYRLPRDVVFKEVGYVEQLGVNIKASCEIKEIEELKSKGYKAVFIGTGLAEDQRLSLTEKEKFPVYTGREFLQKVSEEIINRKIPENFLGKRTAVIGGGNVAMDCAATALRLGAEVMVIYRRDRENMPAWKEELENALEVGVQFEFLAVPSKLIGNSGHIQSMECVRIQLREHDASGRPRPEPVSGSEFQLDVDSVIEALGYIPDTSIFKGNTKDGLIEVNPLTGATSIEGVFAGGDIINGGYTVVKAVGEGRLAALGIHAYLS